MDVSNIMTKNPISIDKQSLAAKALALMNEKKKSHHFAYMIKKISLKQLVFFIYTIFCNQILVDEKKNFLNYY